MKITHSLSDITDWFFETVQSCLKEKNTIMVGLGGGTSFDSWYSQILQITDERVELFQKIRWCVTDERVNCELSERNDEHIWEVFLEPLFRQYWIPEENFIRPTMDSDGVGYTEKIFGFHKSPQVYPHIWAPPQEGGIDIAFFGMGPDGHTASLFPYHPALSSEELWFIKIENAPKLPPERISLSPETVHLLEHVCLFAVGESKKEALANFLDETISVDDCPVKLLKPEMVYTSIEY